MIRRFLLSRPVDVAILIFALVGYFFAGLALVAAVLVLFT